MEVLQSVAVPLREAEPEALLQMLGETEPVRETETDKVGLSVPEALPELEGDALVLRVLETVKQDEEEEEEVGKPDTVLQPLPE